MAQRTTKRAEKPETVRLAAFRRKATGERRRDFLKEAARAARLSPEQRLETALDLIDSLMELREAARHAEDA